MQTPKEPNYLELLKRDYPEELESNGLVTLLRNRCAYLDRHPEQWEREPKWFREAYRKDPEAAILEYSYEHLRSFA